MRPAAVVTLSQRALEWAGAVPLVTGASDSAASVPTATVDSPETTDTPAVSGPAGFGAERGQAFDTTASAMVDAGAGFKPKLPQVSASTLVSRYEDMLGGLDRTFATG